jgi:hypothetical protein
MFAIDHTFELYAHMNANYGRIGELPNFDYYGRMLEARIVIRPPRRTCTLSIPLAGSATANRGKPADSKPDSVPLNRTEMATQFGCGHATLRSNAST